MHKVTSFEGLEVGYDIPALPGMAEADIQTPCLVLDLDALERNVKKMGEMARSMGVRHRVHGKMHKSVDVARLGCIATEIGLPFGAVPLEPLVGANAIITTPRLRLPV